MERVRTALKFAGLGVAGLGLLLALAFGLAQTAPGRELLAAALGRALADPDEHITITGLAGFIPFDMTVERVEIADARGPRLIVSGVAVTLAPADLLAGRLTLRHLDAREVEILRPAEGSHTDLAALLRPPLPLRLEEGRIDRLVIGAAFAGEPVGATVSASGRLGGGAAAADIDLHRIDAVPGEAKLHLALAGTPPRLTLQGDIEEPSGRLLAGLLGQTQPLPVSVHLSGDGPLVDWHGSLDAKAGPAATLQADFTIAGQRYTATGKAQLQALLPPALQQLGAGTASFNVAAELAGDRVAVQRLTLATPIAKLDASGRFDRASTALAGEGEIELADLGALTPLIGAEASGSATLSLALGGSLRAPVARLTLSGERLALAGNRVAAAHATADIGVTGDALDPASPIELSASGDASGLAPAAASLPGGLGQRLDWRLSARLDRAAGRIDIHKLSASDAGSSLVAQAGGSSGAIAGEAMLTVPDIARFAGAERHGALRLAGDFRAAADGSAVAALSGTLSEPRSGTELIDRLLGSEARIGATIRRASDGALSASEISLDGAEVRLTASAERRADGRIAADYRASLPRLAALAPDLAGSAVVAGTAKGALESLAAQATLSVARLSVGPARLDRLEARLEIPDLALRAGRVEASFRGAGLDGTASADGRLEGDRLRLSRIRLEAAGTRLDGELGVQLDRLALEGTLKGKAPDLKPWSALAGMPLAGSAALEARLTEARGQGVDLRLDGTALSLGGASLGTLQATATLADVLAQPTGRAEIKVERAAIGPASVERLRLSAESTRPGRFSLSAEAQGKIGEAFTLASEAGASLDRRGIEIRLTRLAGTLGKMPITLHQPLLLTRRDGTLAVADLDLEFGSGRIAGSGSLGASALALRLKAKDISVHGLSELAGRPQASGVLGFEATLSGSRARPEGDLVIDAEELRFAAASRADLPPLGFVASAHWHQGEARFQGRLAGPQNAALGFSGSAPLALDPQRLAFHLPPQGAVALHLEGGGELANLADLVPMGEDRVGGRFTIDVSVAGTVASPTASGRLSLRDGHYESLFWGTALQHVAFDLVGDRDRLVLQNFTATDGAKGRLSLTGSVELAAASGPVFDITGKFQDFRAVQRDEATGTVSGDVSLAGDIAAPRLGARLTIDQAELRVPDRLPQSLQPIAVTLVDSATGQVLGTPEQSGPSVSILALALDVEVTMPGQVFVRGRGLDSEWRGKLSITGTTAQPSIDGKLSVVRGTYDFIGKTATLNRGTITFLGGRRIDPAIDIEAQASSTDIVAVIDITGTATQPIIKLSSQPALPQDEILARVLFGTSMNQISAAQGLALAQAAASLATGGSPGVLDRLRQGLGLDRLAFGSAGTSSTLTGISMPSTPAGVPSAFPTAGIGSAAAPMAATGATATAGTVTAGKYVANGVYVGVSQGLSASSSSVNVQIDVTRHISIDTTAGQTTGSGVGVNWRLDY